MDQRSFDMDDEPFSPESNNKVDYGNTESHTRIEKSKLSETDDSDQDETNDNKVKKARIDKYNEKLADENEAKKKLESDEEEEDDIKEKNHLEKSFDISSDEDDNDDVEENDVEEVEYAENEDDNNASCFKDSINQKNSESKSIECKSNETSNSTKTNTQFKEFDPTKTEQNAKKEPGSSDDAKQSSMTSNQQKSLVSENKKKLIAENQMLLRRKKIEQIEEENKRMQVLMANFSEEQLNRYEMFRRSAFPKTSIKKIVQTMCGKAISASVVIAMSGIAKVFVGEIVEKALDVKVKANETGPLQPKHLREAFRLSKMSNKMSSSYKYKKASLF